MRISDWSSDVCSSDLAGAHGLQRLARSELGNRWHASRVSGFSGSIDPEVLEARTGSLQLGRGKFRSGQVAQQIPGRQSPKDHPRADRNNVVKAKCESRRVEIGGRRMSKNTPPPPPPPP